MAGQLGGLVIGGVDLDDTADPAATRLAIEAASFVVALELRETEVTRAADVVFPSPRSSDKAGTFVTWEGRPRPFEAVFSNRTSLPDLRILAGIAEELSALGVGRPLGFRTVADVRARMTEMGPWDGPRTAAPTVEPSPGAPAVGDGVQVASWKQMIDQGSMQDGDEHLRATARMPVVRLPAAIFEQHGQMLTLTGDRGSVDAPGGHQQGRCPTTWCGCRRTPPAMVSSPTWPHPDRRSA